MRNLIIKQDNREKKIFLPIIFLFLFSISLSFLSAAPPVTTTQQFQTGYVIEDSPQYILKQNQSYQVNFFVYNLSDGMLINNASVECVYYLAKNNGEVIFYNSVHYDRTSGRYGHWAIDIGANNFSYVGEYSYGIKCNSTMFGGAITGTYTVNSEGNSGGTDNSNYFWILIFLTWGVAFIGFFGKNVWVTVFGGMGMIIFGIYTLTQGIIIYENWVTLAMSYFSMGLGAFFMIYSLVEYIEDMGDFN